MPESNSSNGRPVRAVAYYRMSTDRQEDSIDRQEQGVAACAAARGYQLTAEYRDEGIAGDVFDRRPGFQKMLAAAGRKEFDVVLVDEPSRLSRQNPIEVIEKVIAPLRRASVKIDTVSKGPLDYESLAGLIMLTVHAHESKEESVNRSRRTIGGVARRAAAVGYFGSMPPLGLRVERDVDPATAKVTARRYVVGPEEEVQAVRFIFEAVADRGWSLRRICRELEARAVKPPSGNGMGANKAAGRWNAGTVRKILRNRKYVGDLTWGEVRQGKYHEWRSGNVEVVGPRHGARGRPARAARAPAEDVVIVPDVIPAIVGRDLFARAGAALELAQKRTSPSDAARYLFTHMLTCGDCGAFLRGQPDHGRKGYICAKYKEYGKGACRRNTVAEAVILKAAVAALKDDVLSPARLDAVEAEMERRLKAEHQSGEADRLRKQIAKIGRDVAQGNANLALLPADRLPGVVAQVRQWEGERAGLEERLHDLESGGAEMKAVLAEARKQLWRLRDALEADDEELQSTVIREVVSKAEVRFAHERTHGRRSPTGKTRLMSRPCGLVLYTRPGLGLSAPVLLDDLGLEKSGSRRCISACQ
jgi:site-specific DNA recombinase